MPWVNEGMCVGCGVCVEECPVEAITIPEETAVIDEEKCIRCGRCHDVCPEEAVRHDSERIPQEIEANLDWTSRLLEHFAGATEVCIHNATIKAKKGGSSERWMQLRDVGWDARSSYRPSRRCSMMSVRSSGHPLASRSFRWSQMPSSGLSSGA